MTLTRRNHFSTVEELFGEPLPVLSEEQKLQLITRLDVFVDTLFVGGPYQTADRAARNRLMARRVLLEGALLREAAVEFGVSRTRVSQVRLKALRMLRHPSRSKPLRRIFKARHCEQCGWKGLDPSSVQCPTCGAELWFV